MRGIQNIEVLGKSDKVVTLWENPNPTSAYERSSITLPTDEQYDLLMFEFTWLNSYADNCIQTEITEPKTSFLVDTTTGKNTGVENSYRQVTYNGNHVYTISAAYNVIGTSAESIINNYMIPKKICGINLGASGGIRSQGWKCENVVITNRETFGQMIKALVNPIMPLDLGREYLIIRTSETFTYMIRNNYINPYEIYCVSDTGQGGLSHNNIYGYSRNTDRSSVKGFITDINGAITVNDYTGMQTSVGDIYTFYSRPILSSTESKESDIYSTDEVKTNKVWIDGKPIYRKVIQSTLPNVATDGVYVTRLIPHGLSNVKDLIYLDGKILYNNSDGSLQQALNINTAWGITNDVQYSIYAQFVEENIQVRSNRTALNGWNVFIILEYTKTTD